ncbi:uncharacterized protein [Euwallacea fornicatus]|uniref:uncharacterized protein n=1 Tax=Euwallacea fornicatus TaxID=995702 RepID=UPI00338DAECB
MAGKQPKCFVPKCMKTVGVLFPKNEEAKKKWLKALMLEHLEPTSKSFVCLDHFGKNGMPLIRQKLVTPATQNEYRRENLSQSSGHSFAQLECRLCLIQGQTVTQHIFNRLNDTNTIAEAIGICLHPLKISRDDHLSKHICVNCLKQLKGYFAFHQYCLAMDSKQRRRQSLETRSNNGRLLQKEDISKEISKPSSQKDSDGRNVNNNADYDDDYFLHEEWLTDYDGENKENKKGESKKDVAKNKSHDKLSELIDKTFRSVDKDKEDLLQVLEGDDESILPIVPNSSSYLETNEDSLDDQDQLKDDSNFTESIVIEMVNDENNEEPSLSIDIPEECFHDFAKTDIESECVSPNTTFGMKRKYDLNGHSPKKHRLSNNFEGGIASEANIQSPLGIFPSQTINYFFDSQFVFAAGYLYESRFTKGDSRLLRCPAPNCPSQAYQKKSSPMEYATDIEVVTSHNHVVLDETEVKRQMFYSIMFRKMRRDKLFSFKLLYEQFCRLDHSIASILPLKVVIREICNWGPAQLPTTVNSFDDFYNRIENDEFCKIQFTDKDIQFYLDRFETEDGGKAVVFGNEEILQKYCHSELMFVDASFYIESELFPYQLVTVMVWADGGYIPIFYALINLKSQELYRKIFSFLRSHVSELRPREIVSDYEANLYYALGEVYTDANIGGATYYFTQNIYKKLCSLNLSKELERNANFRNVYHMVLMLPLLPANTIQEALQSIESQANTLRLKNLTEDLFRHIHSEWIEKVTPEMFSVYKSDNRITESLSGPFKKLKDYIMMSKNKKTKAPLTIVSTVEKLIDLDKFLLATYSDPVAKRAFNKDMSVCQKKSIVKAWNFIQSLPTINIYQFFVKVLGYIHCMENQLWIWGFHRFTGKFEEHLIDGNSLALINNENTEETIGEEESIADEVSSEETLDAPLEENMETADEEQTEIIEEYYIEEDSGAVRKIRVRQPATIDFSLDPEQEIEEEIFGHESDFES